MADKPARPKRIGKRERARLEQLRLEAEQRERTGKMSAFLTAFREMANVRASAEAAGVPRSTIYFWRDTYTEFAELWLEAEKDAVDRLEKEAWRRAVEGVVSEHGVYFKDQLLETVVVTTYSDALLTTLLKAHLPEKYRENIRTEHVDMTELTDDELRAIRDGKRPRGF